jgi:antirestriction protein ArdC
MANAKHTTDELLQSLTEGIAELGSQESWTKWLDAQRVFHKYSFNNGLLIARQCPQATRVAGFQAWRQLGRCVRKGEKAIRILAPVTRRDEVTGDNGEPQKVASLVGFRAAAVFDLSQTDGDELPQSPCRRLTEDAPAEAWDALKEIAQDFGYSVTLSEELPDERNGDCNFVTHSIRVLGCLAPAQQIKTLTHELAHALLHSDGQTPREVAELEAESVAYVVCGSGLGIDSREYSLGYVAGWAGGSKDAIEGIRRSGERISRAARRILAGLERVDVEEAA